MRLHLLFTLAISICASLAGCSPRLTPEQKALQHQADSLAAAGAVANVDNMEFIIKAESIQLDGGRTHHGTDNSVNFVAVHDGSCIIQLASARNPRPGPNGMGGITVEGRIRQTAHTIDKKGNRRYEYSVSGAGVSANMVISLRKGSSSADVRISGNFHGHDCRMYGPVHPYNKAEIVVGRHL